MLNGRYIINLNMIELNNVMITSKVTVLLMGGKENLHFAACDTGVGCGIHC